MGVQHQSPGYPGIILIIDFISQDRATDGSQMDTDLVCPPGYRGSRYHCNYSIGLGGIGRYFFDQCNSRSALNRDVNLLMFFYNALN